jgi:16S rRNA (uracil1498-N3)-methyltransferase
MTERRLHVPDLPASGGAMVLSREASKHVRVLRLRVGDPIVLFDGRGRRADAVIDRIDDGAVAVTAGASRSTIDTRPEITLVQALPKHSTLEDVVRATTEVGVFAIRLAVSEHSVSRLDEARGERKRERLERIAEEAARQCERDDVPAIEEPAPIREVASRAPEGVTRLVLCGRTGGAMPAVLDGPIWLVVGPEGGLSGREVAELSAAGFMPVALGHTTMRVCTAATAAVAIAMDRSRR